MKLTMLSSVAGVTHLECAGEVTQNDLWNDANPLEEIAAIRSVELTVKRGVRFPRKDYRPLTSEETAGRL